MIVKLLTEHHLEFLSLKAGCRGLSELEITCHGSYRVCFTTLTSSNVITELKTHIMMLISFMTISDKEDLT